MQAGPGSRAYPQTILEMSARDKHTMILRTFVNYDRKKVLQHWPQVEEESMLKFVIDKTAVPYFANLVWFIGNHILEIDACVRNDAE